MEPVRKRVFIFDLDGTLVWSGGAGVVALEAAFAEVFGIERGMQGIVCDGKTDPAIVREVLQPRGLDDPGNIERLLQRYVVHLPGAVAGSPGYRILPGVRETLDTLRIREDVLCALGTGNVEAGARTKLERAGLNPFFEIGGFGSDAEDRAGVLRACLVRARDRLGRSEAGVVVIGDTPRDVHAGKVVGAVTVAVCTGHFDRRELERAGADVVLESLIDPQTWIDRLPLAPA